MKNKKIRFLPAFLVALLVLTMASGSVFAYMKAKTPVVENKIIPASVNCEVNETFANNEKTSITVKNTGNIDAYLRVCLVSYWVDESGNIVSKPSEMPEISVGEDWVKSSSGNIFYYKTPVAPEFSTGNLLGEKIQLATFKNDDSGEIYYQVIEVFAEAIQSLPADAVTESWGVTLDENGVITAVS